jgi:hypothetical protein
MWLYFLRTNINLAVESCDIAHQFNKVIIYNHGSGVLLHALKMCLACKTYWEKDRLGLLTGQILECSYTCKAYNS